MKATIKPIVWIEGMGEFSCAYNLYLALFHTCRSDMRAFVLIDLFTEVYRFNHIIGWTNADLFTMASIIGTVLMVKVEVRDLLTITLPPIPSDTFVLIVIA